MPNDGCSDVALFTSLIKDNKRKLRSISEKKKTLWQVACCIFALCYPDIEPVAAYLSMKKDEFTLEDTELRAQLHQWCTKIQAHGMLHEIVHPTTTTKQRQHATAAKFLKEWKLHNWVESTNLSKGIAPCSSLICQAGGPPGIEPTAIPFPIGSSIKYRSKLQWLRRWRRRWDVRLGTFSPGERLDSATAQRKVRRRELRQTRPWVPQGEHFGPKSGPKTGATKWPTFWPLAIEIQKN